MSLTACNICCISLSDPPLCCVHREALMLFFGTERKKVPPSEGGSSMEARIRSGLARPREESAISNHLQAIDVVSAASESSTQLRRVLGMWDLVLMIIGTVI